MAANEPLAQIRALIRMKKFLQKVWSLYYDGFRQMTLGRTLWAIILVKLFIIFFVLKLFFFPNYIKEHAREGEEAEFVSEQLKGPQEDTTADPTEPQPSSPPPSPSLEGGEYIPMQ